MLCRIQFISGHKFEQGALINCYWEDSSRKGNSLSHTRNTQGQKGGSFDIWSDSNHQSSRILEFKLVNKRIRPTTFHMSFSIHQEFPVKKTVFGRISYFWICYTVCIMQPESPTSLCHNTLSCSSFNIAQQKCYHWISFCCDVFILKIKLFNISWEMFLVSCSNQWF